MELCKDRVQWQQEYISTVEFNVIMGCSSYVGGATFIFNVTCFKISEMRLKLVI
jgi:hypothetical protein